MWVVAAALVVLQAADYQAEGAKAIEEGRYDAAVRAFTQAIEADPRDYGAHFNLGLAYGYLGRNAEGIAQYRKTLELKPGLYEAELNAAILLLRTRDPVAALPLAAEAVRQKPAEFQPRYRLGEAQLAVNDAAAAAESFRAALEIDGKSAAAELGLARALAAQNKPADAAPHFERATAFDPAYSVALLELAALYEKNGQAAEALAIYNQFPGDAAAQERAAALMVAAGQNQEALPRLQAAFDKDPNPSNRLALAQALVSTHQLDKALPLLAASVAAEPARFDLRMAYARALRDMRQFPAAVRQFAEAVKLKPGDVQAWSDLAAMFYMQDSLPEALAAFDRARDLGENTPGNWFMRAIILDKLKQAKPALEAYRRFLAASQGKNPDQEFQARQRARIIQRELEKR